MGEEKDPKIVGLAWIKVKIIDGTCSGVIGWASKKNLYENKCLIKQRSQ